MVLLKLAFTCATPEAMFLRSRRRTRVASLPILTLSRIGAGCSAAVILSLFHSLFLLAGDCFGGTFAGPRIGMGALTAHRQAASVTQAPVAAEIHQPLDVHGDFTPQIALDHVVTVDHFAQLQDFLVGQLRHSA